MKKVNQLFILLVTFFSCLNSYSQNDPSSERRKPRLIPTKPTILKTQEGYEFKNVIFTDDDKEALLNIYKGKDNDFRLAEQKGGERKVYGTGSISNVRIVDKTENDTKAKGNWIVSKKISFGVFEEHFVGWETKNLSKTEIMQLDKILRKYAPIEIVK